jgi:hypothetical protein
VIGILIKIHIDSDTTFCACGQSNLALIAHFSDDLVDDTLSMNFSSVRSGRFFLASHRGRFRTVGDDTRELWGSTALHIFH